MKTIVVAAVTLLVGLALGLLLGINIRAASRPDTPKADEQKELVPKAGIVQVYKPGQEFRVLDVFQANILQVAVRVRVGDAKTGEEVNAFLATIPHGGYHKDDRVMVMEALYKTGDGDKQERFLFVP